VRGEDGRDADVAEEAKRFGAVDAGLAQAAEGAAQAAALGLGGCV